MKVNTRYSRISQQTALQLAAIRTLFENPYRSTDENIITHKYSISQDPKYPELILNQRFGLAGEWKMINILDVFEKESCAKEFEKVFSSNRDSTNQKHYLWNHSKSVSCEVSGKNYTDGIKNLFKKITLVEKRFKYKYKDPKEKTHTFQGKMPWLLIHKVNKLQCDAYIYYEKLTDELHGTFKKL